MKTTLLVSMFCLSALGGYAQNQNEGGMRQLIHERAVAIYQETNGNMGPEAKMRFKSAYSTVHAAYPDAPANAIPATPTGQYVTLQDPPCYKYINAKGHEVMECPGARFANQESQNTETTINENEGNLNVQGSGFYTGNYHSLQSLYPQAPKNAVPAWPKSPYTELQNPPCYQYTNRNGLVVEECPGAQFAPEHMYR